MYIRLIRVPDSTNSVKTVMCPECGSIVHINSGSSAMCLSCNIKMVPYDVNEHILMKNLLEISPTYRALEEKSIELIANGAMSIIDIQEPMYLHIPPRTVIYRGPCIIIDRDFADDIDLIFNMGRVIAANEKDKLGEMYCMTPYVNDSDYVIAAPVCPPQKVELINLCNLCSDPNKERRRCNVDQMHLPISNNIIELSRRRIVNSANYIANINKGGNINV